MARNDQRNHTDHKEWSPIHWLALALLAAFLIFVAKTIIYSKGTPVSNLIPTKQQFATAPQQDKVPQPATVPQQAKVPPTLEAPPQAEIKTSVTVSGPTVITATVVRIGEGEIWVQPVDAPSGATMRIVVNPDVAIESVSYSISSQPSIATGPKTRDEPDLPLPPPPSIQVTHLTIQDLRAGDLLEITTATGSQGVITASQIQRLPKTAP